MHASACMRFLYLEPPGCACSSPRAVEERDEWRDAKAEEAERRKKKNKEMAGADVKTRFFLSFLFRPRPLSFLPFLFAPLGC